MALSSYNTARSTIGTGRMIDYGEYEGPDQDPGGGHIIRRENELHRAEVAALTQPTSQNISTGGQSSGQSSGSTRTTTTTSVDDRPTYQETSWMASNEAMPELQQASLARPTLEKYSAFKAPTWNRREIEANAQEIAGPSIRQLREATNRAMITGGSQNPNVSKMTYREALQGYGAGLGEVLSGSRSAALGEYTQKYGKDFEAAKISHEADLSSTAEQNLQKSRGAELEYRTQSENNMRTYSNLFDAWKKRGSSITKTYKEGQEGLNMSGQGGSLFSSRRIG